MSKETKTKKGINGSGIVIIIIIIVVIIIGGGLFTIKYLEEDNNENKQDTITTAKPSDKKSQDENEADDSISKQNDNKYIIEIIEDNELTYDIDGDENEEKIKIDVESETINEEDFSYEARKYTLLINDKIVKIYDGDEYICYHYYLMDFDNTDGKYQIGSYTNYGTDDSQSEIFEWNGKTLESIRTFGYRFEESDLNYDKTAGKTKFYSRVDAFKTSTIEKYMQYDKDTCKFNDIEPEDGIYNYYCEKDDKGEPIYYYYAELKKDLKVYKTCEDTAETLLIKAQHVEGTRIKFIYDGNIDTYSGEKMYSGYWVYIQAEDGTKGWMKVDGDISVGEKINGEVWENYFEMMYAD